VHSDPDNGDGTGEHYRAIVYDSSGVNISMDKGAGSTTVLPVNRYHAMQASDIESPVSFTSNTKPFLIYQIDQTNQSSKAPYPRPSMSQIIPMSRWKNSYLWLVPSNVNEQLQGYYINIIGPKDSRFDDSIFISKNGQLTIPIKSAGLSKVKVWNAIPGHPELKGVT